MSVFYAVYPPSASSGVTSLNSLTGAVTLAAGSNISITPAGNTLTIASSGGGGSPTSNYFNGFLQSTTSGDWIGSATTFGDPLLNAGSSFLTTRVSNGITVTAATGNTAGITWTPSSSTAVYMMNVSFGFDLGGAGDNVGFRMIGMSDEIGSIPGQIGADGMITLFGIYAPATTSPVTMRLQCFAQNGSVISIIGDSTDVNGWTGINWQIVQIVS